MEPALFWQVVYLVLIVNVNDFSQPYPVHQDVLQEHRAKKKTKVPKVRSTARIDPSSLLPAMINSFIQLTGQHYAPTGEIPIASNALGVQVTQTSLLTKEFVEEVKLQNRLHLLLVKAFPKSDEIRAVTDQRYRQVLQNANLPLPAPGLSYLEEIKFDVSDGINLIYQFLIICSIGPTSKSFGEN